MLRTIRHVNKKLENHKKETGEWNRKEEERRIKEWFAQIQLNNQLKLENEELKDTVKEKGIQLSQLKQLINTLFLKLGLQTTRGSISSQEAGNSGQPIQNAVGFYPFSRSR